MSEKDNNLIVDSELVIQEESGVSTAELNEPDKNIEDILDQEI